MSAGPIDPSRPLAIVFGTASENVPTAGLHFSGIRSAKGAPACIRIMVAAGPASSRQLCAFVLPVELAEQAARVMLRHAGAARHGKELGTYCDVPVWDAAAEPATSLALVSETPIAVEMQVAPTEPPPADVDGADILIEIASLIRSRFGDRLAGYMIAVGEQGSAQVHFASNEPPETQPRILRGMADTIEAGSVNRTRTVQ